MPSVRDGHLAWDSPSEKVLLEESKGIVSRIWLTNWSALQPSCLKRISLTTWTAIKLKYNKTLCYKLNGKMELNYTIIIPHFFVIVAFFQLEILSYVQLAYKIIPK